MPIPERVRKTDQAMREEELKFKHDHSQFRSPWLDRVEQSKWFVYAMFLPTGCSLCTLTRYVILALAIVGIVSLLT